VPACLPAFAWHAAAVLGARAQFRYRSGEAVTPAGERLAMGLRAFQERFGCP
jgi:hypothetical protein